MQVKRLVDWVGHICQTIDKLIHKVLVNKPNKKRSKIVDPTGVGLIE